MSKFTIEIPAEVRDQIANRVQTIVNRQVDGDLPSYPLFAWNLMKVMSTEAEELHHSCTGIAGEAGEILDISKKVWVYGKPLDLFHLLEELGDLRFYYQTALNMLDLEDKDIVRLNMEKLSQRYSDGKYSDQQAIGRADKKVERPRNFIGMNPSDPGEGEHSEIMDAITGHTDRQK